MTAKIQQNTNNSSKKIIATIEYVKSCSLYGNLGRITAVAGFIAVQGLIESWSRRLWGVV